jgi:hypothetical protein|tara:strand:+ start:113 stop:427 length:315 start_codon:yes stop_codon:yes gene_type:complete
MAGTPIQKKALAKTMATYFEKKGYLASAREFSNDPLRPRLIKVSTISHIFGSWSIMMLFTKSFCPDIMRGITDESPKPVVNPLEALKAQPAKKAEKEGVHGKDI